MDDNPELAAAMEDANKQMRVTMVQNAVVIAAWSARSVYHQLTAQFEDLPPLPDAAAMGIASQAYNHTWMYLIHRDG